MKKIFISYCRQSENITKELVADIQELGYSCWFDHELTGGQKWWNHILEEIRSCSVFVFVLDSSSLESTACKREFEYAAALLKPILPVLVGDNVSTNLLPPDLSQIQFVDYRKQDKQAAYKLANSLANINYSNNLPEPLPTPPEVPISYLGELTERVESSTPLNFEQQSEILVKLSQNLSDMTISKDSLTLLKKLRKRSDLYAKIGDEIDGNL